MTTVVFGKQPPRARGHLRGPELRLGQMVHIFEYLPPMFMQTLDDWGKPTCPWTPICGRCFRQLGDDPFAGKQGQLRPIAIGNKERCFRCSRRCHPCD